MLIKAKWIGTGVANLTTNNVYTCFFLGAGSPIVVDDNGALYDSGNALMSGSWQVISISIPGQVDVFP